MRLPSAYRSGLYALLSLIVPTSPFRAPYSSHPQDQSRWLQALPSIDINPLVTLWIVAIIGGGVCVLSAALSAMGRLRPYADALLEKPFRYYGVSVITLAGLSWILWDAYYPY